MGTTPRNTNTAVVFHSAIKHISAVTMCKHHTKKSYNKKTCPFLTFSFSLTELMNIIVIDLYLPQTLVLMTFLAKCIFSFVKLLFICHWSLLNRFLFSKLEQLHNLEVVFKLLTKGREFHNTYGLPQSLYHLAT